MEWFNQHFLSVLVFLPLLFTVVGLVVPATKIKVYALAATALVFAVSTRLYTHFDATQGGFQFSESYTWIAALGIHYELGVDGLSLWLLLLTTALMPLVILASFYSIEQRAKGFFLLLIALESAILGAFVSLDLFLFYVFWEAMLIPMYFLIGIWGGKERVYAANKFFIFTMLGSLLMLVAIFFLAQQHFIQFGTYSTAFADLLKVKIMAGGLLSPQALLFLAFALAFAIKVPLFPLHTWLPDAHVQAPTAGSVVLAAVMLKLGGYGILRFGFSLFPEAVKLYQPLFLVLGAIAIVYGAWVATVQPDIKKLVAYSSVSHMGYVILGIFSLNSIGVNGAIYQMLNHGVSTGALFLLVGMIYDRRHTREISEFGGISRVMPVFAILFMIMTLSSVALPGTNGFVGEFLILLGTWKASPGIAAVGGLGVIFGAVYMLWMFQRVMYGKVTNPENEKLKDLTLREKWVLVPFVVAVFGMGFFPSWFTKRTEPTVEKILLPYDGLSRNSK